MKGALLVLVAFFVCFATANWPVQWTPIRPSSPDTMVSINLALKQRNLEAFNQLFEAITTPGSPQYGKYRTISELSNMIAPPKAEQEFVVRYLEKRGCNAESFGDNIAAECPAAVLNEVFGAHFHEFKHREFEGVLHRSVEYPTIPKALSHVVTFVTGISTFPANRQPLHRTRLNHTDTAAIAEDLWIVPQTLRNLYNIPSSAQGTSSKNSMAVVEFGLVAGVSMDDLKEFN